MAERSVLALLIAASGAALTLALFVQHGLGYAPCSLCELARLPHLAVLVLGGLALWRGWTRAGLVAASLALVAAFAISLQHVGVEHGWLAVPDSCVVPNVANDLSSLRNALMAQTQPGCDQPGPRFFGLSMAQWHLLATLSLGAIATSALIRPASRR